MIVNLSRLGKNGSGLWQYSLKFVEALHAQGQLTAIVCAKPHVEQFRGLGCTLLVVPECVANTSKVSRLRPVLWFFYSWWLALRIALIRQGRPVVSTTHHALPFLRQQVITIHDLRPYYFPDSLLQRIYFRWLLPKALCRCSCVLTVSHTVKAKIASVFGYPDARIGVIYNAVDADEFVSVPAKLPVLLAVGASWKHKNIHSLLLAKEAWMHRYRVVIVCGRTVYADYLQALINSSDLNSCVELRHEVPFSELKQLYAQAAALVYPSVDEGFGIPPIEAMASGTPVIVSDIPVFREVLGDAAIFVSPDSLESWQHAFATLNNSAAEYVRRGHDCVARYSVNSMQDAVARWVRALA